MGLFSSAVLAILSDAAKTILKEKATDMLATTTRRWWTRLFDWLRGRSLLEWLAIEARNWPAPKALRIVAHPRIFHASGNDAIMLRGDECTATLRLLALARGPFRVSLVQLDLDWTVSVNGAELARGQFSTHTGTLWQENAAEREIMLELRGPTVDPLALDAAPGTALVGVRGTALVAGAWETYESRVQVLAAAHLPLYRL